MTIQIPDTGWFFELNTTPAISKVWHNGKLVNNVQRVRLDINAADKSPIVIHVDLIGDMKISSKIPDEQVEVETRRIPDNPKQLCLFKDKDCNNKNDVLTLNEFKSWLDSEHDHHIDAPIILYFSEKAIKIEADIEYLDDDTSYYSWITFFFKDDVTIRWSPDEGWDYPVEDTIRTMWSLFNGR